MNESESHKMVYPKKEFGILKYPAEMLVRILERCKPKGSAIDLGCGYGRHLKLLQEYGLIPFGIDSDIRCVEYCSKLGFKAQHLSFEQLEVIKDSSFDHAICWESIYYTDFEKAINQIRRIITLNGLLVMSSLYEIKILDYFELIEKGNYSVTMERTGTVKHYFYILRKIK